MSVSFLSAINFRNFTSLNLEFNTGFNFFYGENGSGKTSLLEILHFLGYGKSFRTHLVKPLVNNAHDSFTVFSKVLTAYDTELCLGIEKSLSGASSLKISGEAAQLSDFADALPIQILNQNSFDLLNHGPSHKRKFLDWGLFYLKPDFLTLWRLNQRCLRQRNQALRNKLSKDHIQSWDPVFISTSEQITQYRREYVSLFSDVFQPILTRFFNFPHVDIQFVSGWSNKLTLADSLLQNFQRDYELGYTSTGSHRADLKILIDKHAAEHFLSRGQQKIFVWLMKVAQALILQRTTNRKPVLLIDDLTAELDNERVQSLLGVFSELTAQVFITMLSLDDLNGVKSFSLPHRMFHVKHNQIKDVSRET